MSKQMWAAVMERHGGPEVLGYRRVDRPELEHGTVLLEVRYCGLNALDIFVREGVSGIHVSLPHVSGGDIVGSVIAVGDGVAHDVCGRMCLVDPLVEGGALGESKWGGLAEYIVVPAANLIPLPTEGASPEMYAALPIAYGTAYRLLFDRCQLRRGETLVVLGAAGGVGVACIQLGKRAGARVIACSSSAAKLGRLADIGADDVIDTSNSDFSAEVWRLTGRVGADVVVDYIGRDTLRGSIRAARHGGRVATCGASSGADAEIDLRYVWVREVTLLGSDGWTRAGLEELAALVAAGELVPIIDSIYPLERSAEAFDLLERRRCFGKVLIEVTSESRRV